MSKTPVIPEDPQEWLTRQFEFEFCAECGGDAQHHKVRRVMGNWFAWCNYPPLVENAWDWHPVIAFHRLVKEWQEKQRLRRELCREYGGFRVRLPFGEIIGGDWDEGEATDHAWMPGSEIQHQNPDTKEWHRW